MQTQSAQYPQGLKQGVQLPLKVMKASSTIHFWDHQIPIQIVAKPQKHWQCTCILIAWGLQKPRIRFITT